MSLSPQTCQEGLRFGYVALTVSLALTGDVLWQPGLSDVFPSHVAQISLHRVCYFGADISLQGQKTQNVYFIKLARLFMSEPKQIAIYAVTKSISFLTEMH